MSITNSGEQKENFWLRAHGVIFLSLNPNLNIGAAKYRGRLAPSPTGFLHLGHARTFWAAQARAKKFGGELILRNDDLDRDRCKPEFVEAMFGDLKWFGFEWSEGPDIGGKFAPYNQCERKIFYRDVLEKLRAGNFIYPCTCSRRDIMQSVTAPHAADDEAVYSGKCRMNTLADVAGKRFSWRFKIPDGEEISFRDENLGEKKFIAGKDFGDFVVWRHDDAPAYQLACVVDDAAMQISEVVRGADLLVSTARQILLYRALSFSVPKFFHCELMRDDHGERLAKRHDAMSLRTLRSRGNSPADLRAGW
jgi:glutamyl-tRNA synthetase